MQSSNGNIHKDPRGISLLWACLFHFGNEQCTAVQSENALHDINKSMMEEVDLLEACTVLYGIPQLKDDNYFGGGIRH